MANLEYHVGQRGYPGFTASIVGTLATYRPVIPATVLVDSSGNDISGPIAGSDYATVAASQTNQVLGATGATGDFLNGLLIIPASTSPGAVSITDGGGSAITVFAGGASSVSNLAPIPVPVSAKSKSGAWKVTTGANVSVIAVGKFT